MRTTLSILALVVSALALGPGCATSPAKSAAPAGPAVYVADFELDAASIRHDAGRLSGKPGPVGRVGGRLSGASDDPVARAQELVDLMARSLVKDLSQAGFAASRLPAGSPVPAQGWLLRGAFVGVDEGNRLRRSMVGFGQGKTDVQVVASVHDLSRGTPAPLHQVTAEAQSGSKPGAAPTLVVGPYGAAARFALAGGDVEKNVKQTAAAIAAEVGRYLQQAPSN